MMNYLIERGK